MPRKILPLAVLGLILAACGTIATPVFEEELQETRIAEAATSAAETAAAPTLPPTVTPSETPTEPPTATPTETPIPPTETTEPTEEPATETPVPTEAEAVTEEAGGETGGDEVTGDPANGQTLFTTFYAEANFACNTCHLVDSESQLIGPGLLNVATRAETRVDGQSTVEYIHNSIVHPSDYVVEGYPDMLMPQVYGEIFTEEEINDLVAYLFTLQ